MPSPPRSNRLAWIVGLGVLVIAWALYLRAYGPRGAGGLLMTPALKAPRGEYRTDYRWTIADLHGRPVEFEQFRGRPIFLNVWATWCGPCVDELPAIERLASNPRLKDVAFLAVSIEEPETIRAFAAAKRLKVPFYHSPIDPPEPFVSDAIPATFLIAPGGRIAAAQLGSAQWDDPSVVEFLERLGARTAGPSGPPAPLPLTPAAQPR
jgi:thiol-disulfide isomerase/thioredoxin